MDKKWQWFDVPVFWRQNSCSKLHQHTITYPRTTLCTVLNFRRQECEISVCLSACLVLSDIRNSIHMSRGSHVSLHMKKNTECRWSNAEKKRRRERRTADKHWLSATWSTTDLFGNFTTTSQITHSFFTDMTNQEVLFIENNRCLFWDTYKTHKYRS